MPPQQGDVLMMTSHLPHAPITVDLAGGDPESTGSDTQQSHDGDDVNNITKEAVNYCRENGIENPIEILRYLQKVIVCGRALEVQDITDCNKGETNFIIVNRYEIIDTAFPEIEELTNLRKTLEVEFYGEVCVHVKGTIHHYSIISSINPYTYVN